MQDFEELFIILEEFSIFQAQKKDCISGNTSNQCNLQFSLI